MGKTNTIIELNGKRYNAVTGEFLGENPQSAQKVHVSVAKTKPAAAIKAIPHRKGTAVDGIVAKAKPAAPKPAAPAEPAKTAEKAAENVKETAKETAKTVAKPAAHRATKHIAHHKAQHSQTLMRQIVKKPEVSMRRTVRVQTTRKDTLAKVPKHEVAAKLSVKHVDEKRLKRAEHIAKSNLISRYGQVEVQKPAAHQSHHAAKPAAKSAQPLHSISSFSASTDRTFVQPTFTASSDQQPSLDIFEQALQRASSHKETYVDPKHAHKQAKRSRKGMSRRLVHSGAAALAVVLFAGFFAYQNAASINMRVASSKAGFNASLPHYSPTGFSAGNFRYGSGFVTVSFASNSGDRRYNITQKVSSWDSHTLLDSYVANAAGGDYDVMQAGGRTIYTYGNNNATWVDKGIWYDIKTNGSLSTSQLVDIAQSM